MNAVEIMYSLNPHALMSWEGDQLAIIEDIIDPDGRIYRVEYQCDPDGTNARAWCRYNPWRDNPYSYQESHVKDDGFLCLGDGAHLTGRSPFDLDFTVRRTRFWTTGYSFLREHGYEATRDAIPGW